MQCSEVKNNTRSFFFVRGCFIRLQTDIQGAYWNVARKNKDAFFKIQKLRPLEIVKKVRFYEFLFALGWR